MHRTGTPSQRVDELQEDEARTMAPTAIAALGMWIVLLAGPIAAGYENSVQFPAARAAVVSLDNEPLEIAVLRETSELEPQQHRSKY